MPTANSLSNAPQYNPYYSTLNLLMLLNLLLLIVGLALVVLGANWLTDGAASIAKRFNVSNLVIGLTIVAFGTSAPELTVSLTSALNGNADIAIGNVVGSNIFNILVILGITAMICPLAVSRSTVRVEIPLTILASLVLLFLGADQLFDGEANKLSTGDGLTLLAFFLIFLFYTFSIAKSDPQAEEGTEVKVKKSYISILMIIVGLAALVGGGRLFVDASVSLARLLGMSESIIGLTLVAAGTSLPELATSLVAALKKQSDIAIGNVVGSSIFNIFFILGVSATITPIRTLGITILDYAVMIGAAVLLFFFSRYYGRLTLKRWEGVLLLLLFVGYTAYLLQQ